MVLQNFKNTKHLQLVLFTLVVNIWDASFFLQVGALLSSHFYFYLVGGVSFPLGIPLTCVHLMPIDNFSKNISSISFWYTELQYVTGAHYHIGFVFLVHF